MLDAADILTGAARSHAMQECDEISIRVFENLKLKSLRDPVVDRPTFLALLMKGGMDEPPWSIMNVKR